MNRLKILQDIFKMTKQFGSDFCLVLFLWVLVTAIRTYVMPYFGNNDVSVDSVDIDDDFDPN